MHFALVSQLFYISHDIFYPSVNQTYTQNTLQSLLDIVTSVIHEKMFIYIV